MHVRVCVCAAGLPREGVVSQPAGRRRHRPRPHRHLHQHPQQHVSVCVPVLLPARMHAEAGLLGECSAIRKCSQWPAGAWTLSSHDHFAVRVLQEENEPLGSTP